MFLCRFVLVRFSSVSPLRDFKMNFEVQRKMHAGRGFGLSVEGTCVDQLAIQPASQQQAAYVQLSLHCFVCLGDT